ncbi:MAG TPA: glucose-6-phosphate dehydrogenase assembly protein OpcA [Candidatus Limnocylindrales bacterium]|nr:glucose-6-phosphate dehydrogenase assembly protein OpcA [Candidatus Limnocylindrales bacterium]
MTADLEQPRSVTFMPGEEGRPVLAWRSRASSIEGIQTELARIWAHPTMQRDIDLDHDGVIDRQIGARTSVMNLVVVARRPETGERCAATIHALTGRHPSRTLIVTPADPDGPSWFDANIQAHCMVASETAPATCAETIYLTCGGESGRHLEAIIAPLLIHDLPVTLWWPDEPPLPTHVSASALEVCDRLVIDGSSWHGTGLTQLRRMAAFQQRRPVAISDFALIRQSRWREAIASVFDRPDVLPFVSHVRAITVTYAEHDDSGIEAPNLVKPVYHVAWLASRLGMRVSRRLAPESAGFSAALRNGRVEVPVTIRPMQSELPAGTTLRVEIQAAIQRSVLRADITAEQEAVHARVWLDDERILERGFSALRRTDLDLLAEVIETGGRDPVAVETLAMAAAIIGEAPP